MAAGIVGRRPQHRTRTAERDARQQAEREAEGGGGVAFGRRHHLVHHTEFQATLGQGGVQVGVTERDGRWRCAPDRSPAIEAGQAACRVRRGRMIRQRWAAALKVHDLFQNKTGIPDANPARGK